MPVPSFTIDGVVKTKPAFDGTTAFTLKDVIEGRSRMMGVTTAGHIGFGRVTKIIDGIGFCVDNGVQESILWRQLWLLDAWPPGSEKKRENLFQEPRLRRSDSACDYGELGYPDCEFWERNGVDPLYVATPAHYAGLPVNLERLKTILDEAEIPKHLAYRRAFDRQKAEVAQAIKAKNKIVMSNRAILAKVVELFRLQNSASAEEITALIASIPAPDDVPHYGVIQEAAALTIKEEELIAKQAEISDQLEKEQNSGGWKRKSAGPSVLTKALNKKADDVALEIMEVRQRVLPLRTLLDDEDLYAAENEEIRAWSARGFTAPVPKRILRREAVARKIFMQDAITLPIPKIY